MAMAVTMPHVSNSILQHSLDLHRVDITSMLRGLCRDDLLISSGFGRGTIYSLNTLYQKSEAINDSVNGSDELGSLFSSNVASNVASATISSTRKRRSYRELCALIIELCKTWKTRQDIAISLGYKQDYLRNNVLPRMVADGYLEKLDKESTTSPSQKYSATQKKIHD